MRFGTLGLVTEDDASALERQVREARIEKARANDAWTEISPATRLVRRGPGKRIVVDAETDKVYRDFRGGVFGQSTASIEFVDVKRPLAFTVDHGDVTFYEPTGEIWSEIFERKARREARSKAAL